MYFLMYNKQDVILYNNNCYRGECELSLLSIFDYSDWMYNAHMRMTE